MEKPTLKTWMEGGLDYIALKNLDIDGIRTIGSVLGQSIALDYYIRQVDFDLFYKYESYSIYSLALMACRLIFSLG